MVSVSNALQVYDIREGRIQEWMGSRLRKGMAKVSFVSGDYTSGGVSISGELQAVMNISTDDAPFLVKVVDVSDGIKTVVWDYGDDQKLHARNAISGLVEVASGQINLSGQSVTLEVLGT